MIIYVNYRERYKDKIDHPSFAHNLAIMKLKPAFGCMHVHVYYDLTKWLDSSVGRALHLYRRGHGFESCSGLNFFQALISQLAIKLCA